jgi:hypothetical protein
MGKRIVLPFTFSFTGNSIPEISLLKMAFELMGLVSLKRFKLIEKVFVSFL